MRLLNRAVWDGQAATSEVRRFIVIGLDAVAGRKGRQLLHLSHRHRTRDNRH